jgi:hypothetical protein
VQLLDLTFPHVLGVDTDPGVERTGRVVQQLLLPGINLIG